MKTRNEQEMPPWEEIVTMSSRAWGIFNDEIVDHLTDADYDKNVAIDVDSADWEVGTLKGSTGRLKARRPDARIQNIYYEHPFAERFIDRASETEKRDARC